MTTVRKVLTAKGGALWTVRPDATVYDALKLMAEKDIGAVLVMDEAGQLAGIFSERDYARKVALKGRASRDVKVAELMTSRVYYAAPDDTIEGCLQVMTARRFRHLPVMEDGRLVGIVTIGDVVKELMSEQRAALEQLEHYIQGRPYPGS